MFSLKSLCFDPVLVTCGILTKLAITSEMGPLGMDAPSLAQTCTPANNTPHLSLRVYRIALSSGCLLCLLACLKSFLPFAFYYSAVNGPSCLPSTTARRAQGPSQHKVLSCELPIYVGVPEQQLSEKLAPLGLASQPLV